MTRLRCVLVWKAHSKCGTQTESVRRARSKISRSNWGLHCYRQYDRGDTWVLLGVRKGKKRNRRTSRVFKAKRFSIDLRTYTRPWKLQGTTSIRSEEHT